LRSRHRSAAAKVTGAAPLFAALGDETRLRLVSHLCDRGPASIAELTETTSVTRQAVTKHLLVLEGAGVVSGRREGRASVWELEPRRLAEARRCLEIISKRWDDALGRLKALVEAE
jgi:DNA-binding transcriptional ArsR family regulator